MGKDNPEAQVITSTPYGAQYVNKGLEYGAGLLEGGAPGFYPGQLVAQPGAGYDEGQRQIMEAARGGMPQAIAAAMPAWQSQLMAPDVASNPYVQAMNEQIADQGMRNYERYTRPGIADAATQAGAYGGSRQGVAEALGFSEAQRQIADAQTRMNLGAYGQGLQAQTGAIGQLPMLTGQMTLPGQVMQGQGAVDQAQEQRELDAERERWMYESMQPWDIFQRYMTGTGVSGGTTSQPYYSDEWAQGIGNLLGATTLAGRVYNAFQ